MTPEETGLVMIYPATLIRVVDGDTYELRIEALFHRFFWEGPVRVWRFNAPEMSTPQGPPAKDAAEQLLRAAHQITVRDRFAETYQRQLMDVLVDGQSIADLLIAQGHGVRT